MWFILSVTQAESIFESADPQGVLKVAPPLLTDTTKPDVGRLWLFSPGQAVIWTKTYTAVYSCAMLLTYISCASVD